MSFTQDLWSYLEYWFTPDPLFDICMNPLRTPRPNPLLHYCWGNRIFPFSPIPTYSTLSHPLYWTPLEIPNSTSPLWVHLPGKPVTRSLRSYSTFVYSLRSHGYFVAVFTHVFLYPRYPYLSPYSTRECSSDITFENLITWMVLLLLFILLLSHFLRLLSIEKWPLVVVSSKPVCNLVSTVCVSRPLVHSNSFFNSKFFSLTGSQNEDFYTRCLVAVAVVNPYTIFTSYLVTGVGLGDLVLDVKLF